MLCPPTPPDKATVTTIAGNGTAVFVDGTGSAAKFNTFFRVAVDGQDNIYVADDGNNCSRKITQSGIVTTVAGNVVAGYVNGAIANAQFNSPYNITIDKIGNMYVTDNGNNRVRKITFQ